MRAAIYARMSTDKQSADSPADQIARCREFAVRREWHVIDALVMVDAGISGGSRHDRPGLLTIMDRIWPQVGIVLLNGLVTAGLTLFLAPTLGVLGALLAISCVSVSVASWVVPLLSRRILRGG